MDNKKDKEVNFKKLLKSPKGKALVFFGVYLIFFVMLGILFRTSRNNVNINNNENMAFEFKFDKIEANNYRFNYNIEVDNNTVSYTGEKFGNKQLFFNNFGQYYSETENYFINNSEVWLKTENPYIYYDFIKTDNVMNLIKNSYFLSKTEYESGKRVYNFLLSSNSIDKIISKDESDIEEIPNEVIVTSNGSNEVTEVKFLLNSYCKYKGVCLESMKIILSYDDFGSVKEISSPLN